MFRTVLFEFSNWLLVFTSIYLFRCSHRGCGLTHLGILVRQLTNQAKLVIMGKPFCNFIDFLAIRAENLKIVDIEINALFINLRINLNLTEKPVRSWEFVHTINEKIKKIHSEYRDLAIRISSDFIDISLCISLIQGIYHEPLKALFTNKVYCSFREEYTVLAKYEYKSKQHWVCFYSSQEYPYLLYIS